MYRNRTVPRLNREQGTGNRKQVSRTTNHDPRTTASKGKAMYDTGLIELPNSELQHFQLHSEPVPVTAAITALAQHPDLRTGLASDTVAALAHDARNLITALGLYCDLLDEPGVLTPPFAHYGNELRLVAAAGRRLVSKLVAQGEEHLETPISTQTRDPGCAQVIFGHCRSPWPGISGCCPHPPAQGRLRPVRRRFSRDLYHQPRCGTACKPQPARGSRRSRHRRYRRYGRRCSRHPAKR